MQVNNFSHEGVRAHPPIRRLGVLLALAIFALSAFLAPQAYAQDMPDDMADDMAIDMGDYKNWPQKSRAERLGTFTYVYGGAGFVNHTGSDKGKAAYALQDDLAIEDGDDIFMNGGFGVRFPSDLSFEVGIAVLNGAYDQPDGKGGDGTSPKHDQPVFEMSVLKGFDLGGPPLLRYTLRAGFASIDDPHADDTGFFGVGIAHEPFRAEFRSYDFETFKSDVFSVSYIYDF